MQYCEALISRHDAGVGVEAFGAEQYLDGGSAHQIEVIVGDALAHMYVDELALLKELPRNEMATVIFRDHYLAHHPGTDPESLPWIAGTAVLFDEMVEAAN